MTDSCVDNNNFIFKFKSLMKKQATKGKRTILKMNSMEPTALANQEEKQEQQNRDAEKQDQMTQQRQAHRFILSQFKQKYDKLRDQFEQKKKQANTLLYDKKKLQIELLNCNVEYYQKQIVRLRDQVEKHQLENEENKHKFFVAENGRKDLQATSKVKQEELKQTLKRLQQEKITVAQLRYQLKQKDNNFRNVISDLEASNQDISEKYDATVASLNKAQSQLKIKCIENEQLKRQNGLKIKDMERKQQQRLKQVQKFQLNQYRLTNKNQDLEEKIKQLQAKQKNTVKLLQIKIKELQEQKTSQQLLILQKNQVALQIKDNRSKEQQIQALQNTNNQLNNQLQQKNKLIKGLQTRLKNACDKELVQQLQIRSQEDHYKHVEKQSQLQARISDLEKELSLSKLNLISMSGLQGSRANRSAFQNELKDQIQENTKLKKELGYKIEDIYKLKNEIEELKMSQSYLHSQIQIMKKKQKAQDTNSKIQSEIQVQNLVNDLHTMRRKFQVTETRLNMKIKQIKDKDSFISNVIMGRSRQEDVPFIVAELQRVFEGDYVSKLNEAFIKISELESKLKEA